MDINSFLPVRNNNLLFSTPFMDSDIPLTIPLRRLPLVYGEPEIVVEAKELDENSNVLINPDALNCSMSVLASKLICIHVLAGDVT